MMEVTKVKEAYRLLEQYEKLKKFLDDSPDDPESITFTLRKGKESKSVTLRPYPLPGFDMLSHVESLEVETLNELRKLGVDV